MKASVKEILKANRESVIRSIKFVFRVWKNEDVKEKMVDFLAYAESNLNADELASSKNVKTLLKYAVQKMAISQKPKPDGRKWYEIAEDVADQMGLSRNSMTGEFTDVNGKVVNI